MKTSDFDYALPPALIAQHPPTERGQSRLLHLPGGAAPLEHRQVAALPDLLRTGDLLVFNDTRVIPARVFGRKATGGQIEVLLERAVSSHRALVQVRASKAPKAGELFLEPKRSPFPFSTTRPLDQASPGPGSDAFLRDRGDAPPPYIERSADLEDHARYQTVYARHPGRRSAHGGLHTHEALRGIDGGLSRPPLPCTWGEHLSPVRGRANGPSRA